MFKVVALLKRKPGISRQQFIDYYQSHHAKIGEKYLAGRAVRYVRRFFLPLPTLAGAPTFGAADGDYDAIMEMWFTDQAQWAATMAIFGRPEIIREVTDDEAKLFDRDRIRMYAVEEYESALEPAQ